MLPLSSFITSTSSSLVVRRRGPPVHALPPPPPPSPPPPPLPPRRHSHSHAAPPPPSRQTPRRRQSHPAPQSTTTTSNNHMAALRSTSFLQSELDQARQAIEAELDAPSLSPLVATALRQTVLRSILKDREKACTCMTGLLLGNKEAAAARLELNTAQASQKELLKRCHDALAFAPLVSQLEFYARDRNLQGDCTSYCLDLGNKSWVRIKTTQTHFALPRSSPLFQHFDGCTLEVTRTLALADLKPDMTGSALYRLFQPVEATLVGASLAWQELQVVVEVGSSEGGLYGVDVGGGGGGGGAFRLACYGYRTFYPKHAYEECEGLVKTWAATLPPSTQRHARRHVVGMSVPVPHPLLVADRSGPLEVMVSIVS